MKHLILPICFLALASSAAVAGDFAITRAKYSKIQEITKPVMLDSVDNSGAKFDAKSLLSLPSSKSGESVTFPFTLDKSGVASVHQFALDVENRDFAKAKITVNGAADYVVNVDGIEYKPGDELALRPATHRIKVKVLTVPDSAHTVDVKLESQHPERFAERTDGKRMFVHEDVMHGRRASGISLSPDGRWLIVSYTDTRVGGGKYNTSVLVDTRRATPVRRLDENANWMPLSSRLYVTWTNIDNTLSLVVIDPSTAAEEVLASDIPSGDFYMSPDEKSLVYTVKVEGPKETPNGYQILEPDDRQPGWRDRSYPAIYDLETGKYQRLTVNSKPIYNMGMSLDGKKMLLQSNSSRLSRRPTTVSSIYILNMPDMRLDTIVSEGEFINSCTISPDGRMVMVSASPEAFGRIGCVTDSTVVPSMIQTELYLIDAATKQVTPMTRDFDPNVQTVLWSSSDNMVYFTAENRDKISLYRLDPSTDKITELPVEEEYIKRFDIATAAPVLAYYGQSASNPDGVYVFDIKKSLSKLIDRPSAERLADVDLIECKEWNFKNQRGDTIYGRYYLPDNFDKGKKYPVIVYYYGGCSPTSRTFDSRYPFHAYAALGYVVYVVEPSGATGFGQEFASRHVSTAGEGVADDIIEGTKKFLAEHPFTDRDKVGCLGASYGGFMTQYLQTVTDIFAAAVSHAGISDHTSYWGEGYWGYSYSEVSMGNDKPWTAPDLYVKQSPLFRADKIHTPLLLVHGDSDHNVPVGESIQLFTALKLLGRETALVQIPGEDHWILGYDNQKKWQETIFAWFAKYLKNNPDWWDNLYPKKNL